VKFGIALTGKTVTNLAIRVYIKQFYDDYKVDGNFERVVKNAAETVEEMISHNVDGVDPDLADSMEAYETARKHLIIRAISSKYHSRDLETAIYMRIGDVAVCLYLLIGVGDNTLSSVKVVKHLVDKWGLSEEDLFKDAARNTAELFPPRLSPMGDVFSDLKSVKSEANDFMNPLANYKLRKSFLDTYVLTDSNGMNGATALFYAGVPARLAELFKGDFYAIMPSVHEALIHPATTCDTARAVDLARSDTMGGLLNRDEMLSSKAFRYKAATGKLVAI